MFTCSNTHCENIKFLHLSQNENKITVNMCLSSYRLVNIKSIIDMILKNSQLYNIGLGIFPKRNRIKMK